MTAGGVSLLVDTGWSGRSLLGAAFELRVDKVWGRGVCQVEEVKQEKVCSVEQEEVREGSRVGGERGVERRSEESARPEAFRWVFGFFLFCFKCKEFFSFF